MTFVGAVVDCCHPLASQQRGIPPRGAVRVRVFALRAESGAGFLRTGVVLTPQFAATGFTPAGERWSPVGQVSPD